MTEEERETAGGQAPEPKGDPSRDDAEPSRHDAPEPPLSFEPQASFSAPVHQDFGQRPENESLRRMIGAAQIMALVSFIIGGVFLSGAAVVVAIMSYRKASSAVQSRIPADPQDVALKRSAAVALAMGIVALAANVVALAVLYPMIVEMLQTGDYSSIWTSGESTASSSSSFWG